MRVYPEPAKKTSSVFNLQLLFLQTSSSHFQPSSPFITELLIRPDPRHTSTFDTFKPLQNNLQNGPPCHYLLQDLPGGRLRLRRPGQVLLRQRERPQLLLQQGRYRERHFGPAMLMP